MPDALSPEKLLVDRRWIDELARRLVRDPNAADDVAQETWRRVLERPPMRIASPRGWLRSVMKSCAREQRRSDARRTTRERVAARPEATPGAAHLVSRADAQRFVLAEVLALDPLSRDVVLLRYFEDLAPRDIARRIGAPEGTVRSRLHRALAALRTRLDHEYGGDGAAWGAAILGPRWESSANGGAIWKGAVVMTSQTKSMIAAAALLALLLASWVAIQAASMSSPQSAVVANEAVAAPRPAPVRRDAPAHERSDTQRASASAASEPPATAPTSTPAPPKVASGPKRLEVRLVRLGDPVSVANAGPPNAGKPGAVGGSAGGVSISGGIVAVESKWRPVPEKGTATLRGKVVDAAGAALGGARILRVEDAAGGADGDVVSYAHVESVGEAAADGSFTLRSQPARAYRLVADWNHAMDRPRGILLGGPVAVEPRENQTVDGIELRLPIDTRDFGAVVGRVLDDEGDPVQVGVSAGAVAATSGADGRFRIAPVPAGDVEIAVDDYEFRPFRLAATVRAGADVEVDVRLTPKSVGPHEIDGVVRDADGKGVADATVSCRGLDVSRRQRTGADGSFRFRRLPALPRGAAYSLFVGGDGVVVKFIGGIAAPSHGLVVEVERSVKLRLLIRDAATAEALPVFNVTIERRVVVDGVRTTRPVVVTSLRYEEGAWSADVPRGDLILFVEAPDRRDFHGEVDVPHDDGEYEAVVEMRR